MQFPKVHTPNYYGARGTIQTCSAEGFLAITVAMTVPAYYGSLVLQAFVGMKNNFEEQKYRWIEKLIHLVAWCIPLLIVTVLAATENINPSGSACWYAKYPKECDTTPDIDCERGKDIGAFALIVGLTQLSLYFIFPPIVILAMHYWIKKIQKKKKDNKNQVREAARKEMLQSISKQMTLYLLAFWSTFILGLVSHAYQLLSGGKILYNLLILANSIYALQGFVFMLVYFKLDKMGKHTPQFDSLESALAHRSTDDEESLASDNFRRRSSLRSLRRKSQAPDESNRGIGDNTRRRAPKINIFDGTPYRDSPWAKFVLEESYLDDSVVVDRKETGIFICTELIYMENECNDLHVPSEWSEKGPLINLPWC